MDAVLYEVRDQVALLTLNHPPVNGIGSRIRPGVLAGLDRALADPAVIAIVLTGGEVLFSGGADVSEFGTPLAARAPSLANVIAALENAGKPVVAAIAGNCLGGGLELAMGCHWRVAHGAATLGLPEVKLGLLPGAGGTQRLPRALGLERALHMIVSGDPMRAELAAGTPLLDMVTAGSVVDAAMELARRMVAEQRPLRRLRDLRVEEPLHEAFLQFARTSVKAAHRFLPAPLACVDAVANAVTQPFDEGLKRERASFITLMNSPESRALRHAFFSERSAAKVDSLPSDTPVRAIARVGVIGAGTMGGGITLALLAAGLSVVLLETSQAALDKGLEGIRRALDASLQKGRLSEAQRSRQWDAITPTLEYDSLANVDLVIEAVFENMDVKRQVFGQLDAVCRPGAILASNTSALDLNQIAAFTRRPRDVVGLHFFSPAHVMRLLEVVRGDATAPDVLASAMDLARRLKKVAVVSGVCEGFIGNRMLARYGNAANGLLDIGASPQQVDKALEAFGFAMGIYRVGDLAGLDIGWSRRKNLQLAHPDRDFSVAADRLCAAGRFGQKTGAGWYRYETGGRSALPDPEVDKMLTAWRLERGIAARRVTDAEIVERCMFALVNEGARILSEGIAQRAGDIDVVYLNGYGFPRFRGGPMAYADEVGLPNVVRVLRRIAAESPAEAEHWTPAPLLVELAESGRTFNGSGPR